MNDTQQPDTEPYPYGIELFGVLTALFLPPVGLIVGLSLWGRSHKARLIVFVSLVLSGVWLAMLGEGA